jgi:release factor glutamine methyltransferase
MDIKTAINEGNKILKENNIRSSLLDSEILMSETIKKNRKYVIMNLDEKLNQESSTFYKSLIRQRSSGKPIAYLIGNKDFWKYEFEISDKVLIPRPDTELIVDEVLKLTKNKSQLNILDIGVGSGCILLSILKEKKGFYGIGIDVSQKCIDLSKINTHKLGLEKRVKFFKSDIDNFSYGKYDLIISNPPYIKKLDLRYLERDIFDFEPRLALDGGLDGLSVIRKVIEKSSRLVKNNGTLILEIAFDQKDKVKKLLKNRGFYIKKVLKDLAKNNRCIISTKI